MTITPSCQELPLVGLVGGNPLGFLAALGALRSLSLAWPDRAIRMHWQTDDSWHPVVSSTTTLSECELLTALESQLTNQQNADEFNRLGDDLSVSPDVFRAFATQAVTDASPTHRSTADFAAAFGSEAFVSDNAGKLVIQDTALRTMAGAGHQHFLGFMRNIIAATTAEHLRKTLFESWRYEDPVQNLTLRFDPQDDVRYALQWQNPSGDPLRRSSGSMLGANRLAIEALPLLTTAPVGTRLLTTGFIGQRASTTFWRWPLWDGPASIDVVRSLLTHPDLFDEKLDIESLTAIGFGDIYQSQRLTIGKVRNFSPATSILAGTVN